MTDRIHHVTDSTPRAERRRRSRAAAWQPDVDMEHLAELVADGKVVPTPHQRTALGFYLEGKKVAAEVAAEDAAKRRPPAA